MDPALPVLSSISIPTVQLVTRNSLFSPKYAVRCRQVYEVHYCCAQDTVPRTVRRRYSEFHKFHAIVSHKERQAIGAPFPKKKWIRSWTPQVVENRRRELEAWLLELARRPGLRAYLLDFLNAVPVAEDSHTNTPTPGEQIITQALNRLASLPHMRLATLEQFEKDFFELRCPVNGDYILAFVQKLVPMCSDIYLGCKTINILAKLVTRESNRGYVEVIRILRSLPIPTLREMHLEKHLLKAMQVDTGEESFRLTKVLSQEDASKSEQLVRSTQLNFHPEAIEVYRSWVSGTLASGREALQKTTISWREIDCSDCMGLKILFSLTPEGVEVDTQLFVDTYISRLLTLLTVAEERRKWDTRTRDIITVGERGHPGYSLQLLFDMPGKANFCTLDCDLTQDGEDHATIILQSKAEDQSLIQLRSVYTISTVRDREATQMSEDEDDEESEEMNVSLALSDSEAFTIPLQKTRCLVTNKLRANTTLSRVFASDIIGEAEVFKSSWVRLKVLAEGEVHRDAEPSDLNSAMERKATLGRRHLESFHSPGFSSPRDGRYSLSLSQRMSRAQRK